MPRYARLLSDGSQKELYNYWRDWAKKNGYILEPSSQRHPNEFKVVTCCCAGAPKIVKTLKVVYEI